MSLVDIDYELLSTFALFSGIEAAELKRLISCLHGAARAYPKGSFLFHRGDRLHQLGVVLTGRVQIVKEDFHGNRMMFAAIERGQLFGEAYACLQDERLEVSIMAAAPCTVLYLSLHHTLQLCQRVCACHTQLIQNFMLLLAQRNLYLTRKVEHMGRKTTQEKLLSYLHSEVRRQNSASIEIPFNRQELADYLAVDRSAMSAELSKLRAKGLLSYRKNHFVLRGLCFDEEALAVSAERADTEP